MVITIEPSLSTGAGYVDEQPDGWTLCVPDNSFVAQHESHEYHYKELANDCDGSIDHQYESMLTEHASSIIQRQSRTLSSRSWRSLF
ncbi:methionine aminopeptidase [compost metagenome]